jgi:hypothetical protein
MTATLGHVSAVAGARVTARLDPPAGQAARGAEIHALVRIDTRWSRVFASIRELHLEDRAGGDRQVAELELIGEQPRAADGALAAFQRGVVHFPGLGDPVTATDAEDLRRVYVPARGAKQVRVGDLDRDGDLPAIVLSDDLLSKHFAILGSTGSGKSCAVAVLLRQLLHGHPNGHVILLDPHDEYRAAFGDQAMRVSPESMSLPFWLLNFEEMVELFCSPEPAQRELEADILKRAVLHAKEAFQGDGAGYRITVDTPVPFRLTTVVQHVDKAMGQLDKASDSLPYLRLKARIETLRADRRFAFMFGGISVQDTMPEVLSRLLRIPVAGRPITIVHLSAVPVEIVDAVVSLLCRVVFDFAVWSGEKVEVPVLLVCEEAHRYIPADGTDGFGPTRKALGRIAKEGRKYGISLGLVTQRPSELSETILSQCGTLFALRLSNDRDQAFVQRALPDGARALFNALPALGTRESVVVGEGTAVPMRMRFAELPEALRPRAGTASFAAAWQLDDPGAEVLAGVIDRWRRQVRDDPPAQAAE